MIVRINYRSHGFSHPMRRNRETKLPPNSPVKYGTLRGEKPLLANSNLSSGYFPTRGFLHSLLIHAIAVGGMLFIHSGLLHPAHHPAGPPIMEADEFQNVIWLPVLQGDAAVEQSKPPVGSRAGSAKTSRAETSPASAQGAGGFSYPGPQPILSAFPRPTNRIQTVLQPALKSPATLVPPLLLPNFIQMADARREPPVNKVSAVIKPAEEQPGPQSAAEVKENERPLPTPKPQPLDTPRLLMRATEPKNDPVPEIKPVEQTPSMPAPPEGSALTETSIPEASPKPAEPKAEPKEISKPVPAPKAAEPPLPKTVVRKTEPVKPVAERKEVSKPKLDSDHDAVPGRAPQAKPGEKKPATEAYEPSKIKPASLPGSGSDAQNVLALTPMPARPRQPVEIPNGEARGNFAISPKPNLSASEKQPGFNSDKTLPKSRTDIPTNPASPAAAKTSSAPRADSTAAARSSAANGSRTGSASGGTGSGTGAGSGSVRSPFPGITVYGAVDDDGEEISSASNDGTLFSPQKSYGYTIISTEASGGGLPSLGVFSQDQFYTVYLDMRRSPNDPAPSWTLEYALYNQTHQPDPPDDEGGSQGLVLPFPMTKQYPDLPRDVVRKYLRQLVIVYAVVNADGRMEQMSVTETPDGLLNQPVLDALRKWIFHPGQLDGQPVAMKVLIGIPLWLVK